MNPIVLRADEIDVQMDYINRESVLNFALFNFSQCIIYIELETSRSLPTNKVSCQFDDAMPFVPERYMYYLFYFSALHQCELSWTLK